MDDLKKDKLPNLPSALLQCALDDMSALNRKDYAPVSYAWHEPATYLDEGLGRRVTAGYCMVCLAGGVMAGSLGFDPIEEALPDSKKIPDAIRGKLYALDRLRSGNVGAALLMFQNGICGYEAKREVFDWKHKVMDSEYFRLAFGSDQEFGWVAPVYQGGSYHNWKEWSYVEIGLKRIAEELKSVGL